MLFKHYLYHGSHFCLLYIHVVQNAPQTDLSMTSRLPLIYHLNRMSYGRKRPVMEARTLTGCPSAGGGQDDGGVGLGSGRWGWGSEGGERGWEMGQKKMSFTKTFKAGERVDESARLHIPRSKIIPKHFVQSVPAPKISSITRDPLRET